MLLTELIIPNRYEVIPIHNSDRGSFKRCREYWNWSSPARQNLMVRADVHGINIPMFFGTGIHYALQSHYTPELRRDPVESFKTWFDVQWRGGIVTTEWLDLVYDLEPQPVQYKTHDSDEIVLEMYQVRGLEDILPDPNHEEFDELFVIGIEMMKFYKEYAAVHDDFEPIVAEHDFSVPIWDYENDCIMKRVDVREESPNYGKELEVHARGRQDVIKQNVATGRMGIIDHKTTARIDEDLYIKLETDEQCTTYLWAAQIEAQYYDLPHKNEPLEEVLFNVLRKAYPKPPTLLKDGYSFSVNRQSESTTYDMLMAYIDSLGEKTKWLWPSGFSPTQTEYIKYLRDVGDEQFIIRKHVKRNQHQLRNMGERIYMEACDMLDDPRIYNNLRNDYTCINCQFRAPCLAKMSNDDWEQLINDNYVVSKDR